MSSFRSQCDFFTVFTLIIGLVYVRFYDPTSCDMVAKEQANNEQSNSIGRETEGAK